MQKTRLIFLIVFLFISNIIQAQIPLVEEKIELKTPTGSIFGTLMKAKKSNKNTPFVLIIAGSGPTDRDGNNSTMKNNSLKFLAEELAKKGISSVRFDKRGVAESIKAGKKEEDLRFEDYINDALAWVKWMKNEQKIKKISIIGHSEGALIGSIVAQHDEVQKFVSLAGAGQPIDIILKDQLSSKIPKNLQEIAFSHIDSLKMGKLVKNPPFYLMSLFRPSVQPYLISWMKYNPQTEIAKLNKPILILNGINDSQVPPSEADFLHKANPKSQKVIIEKMNHVLKIVENQKENLESYNIPTLPISSELIDHIATFVKK